MNGERRAEAELHALLGHPALRGRWPEGFTGDDVLAELMALGRLTVDVRDHIAVPEESQARFCCRLELRDESSGAIFGEGRTLTAAALRCLIDAEADLAAEVERGLGLLSELLGER